MSRNPERHLPPGSEPQHPPLRCPHCGTPSTLFISSVAPPLQASSNWIAVYYTCIKCRLSYCHRANADQFAGTLNTSPGSDDVLVFGTQYIHCGQSMQKTASSVLKFEGRLEEEEFRGALPVYLDVRVMECPCGFRLVLPD